MTLISIKMWSQQESNLYLEFRKLLFYPLNYETIGAYIEIFDPQAEIPTQASWTKLKNRLHYFNYC